MPFEHDGICYSTIVEAGSAYCAKEFPQLEVAAATTTQLLSCSAAIQSPLNSNNARLTIQRSNGGTGAPTAINYEVAFRSCSLSQGFQWQNQSHLLQGCLIAGAVLCLFMGFRSGDRVI